MKGHDAAMQIKWNKISFILYSLIFTLTFACGNSSGGSDAEPPPVVQLSLACRSGSTYCTPTNKRMTNTIKDDNLPAYTVSRSGGQTTSPVTVTLEWTITSQHMGPTETVYSDNHENFGTSATMDVLGGGLYAFQFLKGSSGTSTEMSKLETVDVGAQTFTITIPAGATSSSSFRLEPSQLPRYRTNVAYKYSITSNPGTAIPTSGTVGISVIANSGYIVSTVAFSEELTIEYNYDTINQDD